MMVTTRLGYCCAALGAAQTRTLSKAVSRRKTYRIGDLSAEFPRRLRLRDHGQQEIRHLAGAEVQGIAAGENGGRAVVRIGVREGADALHRVGRVGKRSEERRVGKECRSRWSPYP